MSASDVFTIVGSALNAQDARMSAIASNLANVDSVTPPGSAPYRAHEVVFEAAPVDMAENGVNAPNNANGAALPDMGVSVAGTVLSNAPPKTEYDPGNPYANAQGYVTSSNVSQVGQMVDLIDSSNTYAASVAVLQQASRVDQQMLSSFQVA
ncbi:MAG TPA: flagellar basal body rod protein FlgC [Acidocella sp.]|nr:flagellar basal body rod protein FlgC [Acidocella sp.]